MLVDEFIKEYNAAVNKEKFAEKHVVSRYLSYASKMDACRNIINLSMYKEVGGERVFCPDSPAQYFLFVIAVVENYTDISFGVRETGSGGMGLEGFDFLEKSSATETLIKAIGPDVKRLDTVLKMMVNDVMDKERSIVPFLETKVKAWQVAMEAMGRAVAEKVNEK